MIERFAGSTRAFGVLVLLVGALLSVFEYYEGPVGPIAGISGKVMIGGLGLIAIANARGVDAAAVKADDAASKAKVVSDQVADVQANVHTLTNGGLKQAIDSSVVDHLTRIESKVDALNPPKDISA